MIGTASGAIGGNVISADFTSISEVRVRHCQGKGNDMSGLTSVVIARGERGNGVCDESRAMASEATEALQPLPLSTLLVPIPIFCSSLAS